MVSLLPIEFPVAVRYVKEYEHIVLWVEEANSDWTKKLPDQPTHHAEEIEKRSQDVMQPKAIQVFYCIITAESQWWLKLLGTWDVVNTICTCKIQKAGPKHHRQVTSIIIVVTCIMASRRNCSWLHFAIFTHQGVEKYLKMMANTSRLALPK